MSVVQDGNIAKEDFNLAREQAEYFSRQGYYVD